MNEHIKKFLEGNHAPVVKNRYCGNGRFYKIRYNSINIYMIDISNLPTIKFLEDDKGRIYSLTNREFEDIMVQLNLREKEAIQCQE